MTRATSFLTLCVLGVLLGPPQLFAQTGSVGSAPNPCTIYYTQSLCTSTVSWSSQGTTSVQVWVSVDGGSETLFASSGGGGTFPQDASWIQAIHSYVFRLYDYSSGSRGALLASRTVTAITSILCPP